MREPGWTRHYEDATLHVWSHRELLVAGWFDAPTLPQMREVGRLGKELATRHERGSALANVIVAGLPRFSDEVRAEGIRIAKSRTFRRGSVHVILIGGLVGAATRAFMSMVLLVGMKTLDKGLARTRVFGDIQPASAWFTPVLGGEWTAPEMARLFGFVARRPTWTTAGETSAP